LFFRALKAARHPEALNAEETAKLKGMAEGLTPLFKA
jgi:hypothetical protein